jgi:glyoxylase-like metal-dependent hydrolase (beta-lactamase superfamily II)
LIGRSLLVITILAAGCGTAEKASIQNRGTSTENWWDDLPRPAWSAFPKVLESQGWFEVYEIRPGLFAIYEPGQFEEVISYLMVGSEKALLFDTGLGIGDMRAVVDELTDLDPIVVNSHTHYDHVGGNHQFDSVYGTTTEYTARSAKGQRHEDVAEFVSEGWIWKKTPPGFDRDRYESKPFTVVKSIGDSEGIDLGGRKLEILLTPGHAPDALCLLDRENRLLFTGDTYYPAALYAHLPGSDFGQYRETAARLAELADDVDFVLPAHNEPLLPSERLVGMRNAFEAVAAGKAEFVLSDGNREYTFEGVSILTPDAPP